MAAGNAVARRHRHRGIDWIRPLDSGDERRGISGAGLPRDRAAEGEEPPAGGYGDLHLQPGVHGARQLFRSGDHSGRGPAAVLRQPHLRPRHAHGRAGVVPPRVPGRRRVSRVPDAGRRREHGDRRVQRRSEPCVGRRRADRLVP